MPPIPPDQVSPSESSSSDGADELMDVEATCRFFGGTKPIHRSTLDRGVKAGRYPPPAKVSPNIRRWIRGECVAARNALFARRRHKEVVR